MLRRMGLAVVLVAAMAITPLAVANTSHTSARQAGLSLPRVPADLNADAKNLVIRPATIFYTGDGTGILTGPTVGRPSGIHWRSWTETTALGSGDNQINNCSPSCAGGRFTAYPVRLEMWKPVILHGQHVYARLTLWYTAKRPAGQPAHYTFTDLYSGGWGFGPPDADGYCTHTEGQPKAAGCANIDALP